MKILRNENDEIFYGNKSLTWVIKSLWKLNERVTPNDMPDILN